MVGGKVVQVYEDKGGERTWVNTEDKGDYCAIYVHGTNLGIDLGDKLWWQQGRAWWTPAGAISEAETRELKKLGCSGVNHPLGPEFQLRYDMRKIAEQRKREIARVKEIIGSSYSNPRCAAEEILRDLKIYLA